MTTYPAHRLHFRQPHPRLWLAAAAVVAALVGVGAWLLVDHYTGGAKGISDAQAITFIQTGRGLPGLNAVNGNPNLHGTAMPAKVRPYALRMYRSGPYTVRALNLFYAVGAAGTHFASKVERQAILGVGRARLTAMVAGRVTRPQWITRYGVTVDEAATAAVRGMLAGAATG